MYFNKFMFAGIIFTLVSLLIIDNKLYYYGKSKGIFAEKVPFNLVPEYLGADLGTDEFVFTADGLERIIKKNEWYPDYRYEKDSVYAYKILAYGYGPKRLLFSIVDLTGKQYKIEVIPPPKPIDIRNNYYKYKIYETEDVKLKNNLKWYDVSNVQKSTKSLISFYNLGFISLLSFGIILSFKVSRRKKI